MAKKKIKKSISINHSDLLEMIDDQIYKHLPIAKISEMIKKEVKEAMEFKPKERKKAA